MSELLDKYQDSIPEEILAAASVAKNAKDKAALMGLAASKLRANERKLKDEIKQESEDSKEEKKALKKTHDVVFETRKEYLEAYRIMNAIMSSKSMLKHLGDFSKAVSAFKEASEKYQKCLDDHLVNLATVKRLNG